MRPDTYRPPDTELGSFYGDRRYSRWSKLISLVIFLLIVGGLGAAGWMNWRPLSSDWLSDPKEGLAAGKQSKRPVLVLYTASWCPPCRQLKRDVLDDRRIDAFLAEQFVLVKVDLSDRNGPNNRFAVNAAVTSLPTMILHDPKGKEIRRIKGGEAIGDWIRKKAER